MSLEDHRAEINNLDSELLRLLNRRASIAMKVGASKQASGLSLCDHTRSGGNRSHVQGERRASG